MIQNRRLNWIAGAVLALSGSALLSASPALADTFVHKGDTVQIQASFDTTDPNEIGEGEPLVISGPGFSTVVSIYAFTQMFQFTATADGDVSYFILGADGDETPNVIVTIIQAPPKDKPEKTQQQIDYYRALSEVYAGDAEFYHALVKAGEIYHWDWVMGDYLNFEARLLEALAKRYNDLANDPSDPNYKVIASPVVHTVPLVVPQPGQSQSTASVLNTLFANQVQQMAYIGAIMTSFNRAQGAFDAGDKIWMTTQEQAIAQYSLQLADLCRSQIGLQSNLLQSIQKDGVNNFYVSPSDIFNLESEIANFGLPQAEIQTLQALGLGGSEIDEIRQVLIAQDINLASGSLYSKLTDPTLIGDIQHVVQALTPVGATDVSSQIRVGSSGLVYNRSTQTFYGNITLTNTGKQTLTGPLQFIPSNLTVGVTVMNYLGTNGGILTPGASITIPVQFSNPGNAPISYTPTVYVGNFHLQ